MRPRDVPPAEYPFSCLHPPPSGNAINKLGVREKVRPAKIAPEDFTLSVRVRDQHGLLEPPAGHVERTIRYLGVETIETGLGQLGKHGSIITRELGSSVRLAMVLTDLPLATDQPVDRAGPRRETFRDRSCKA